MCDTKRLNKLKDISRNITRRFEKNDPLSSICSDYVSGTGLTFTDIRDKIEKVSNCSSLIELKETFEEKNNVIEQVLKVSTANFCKQHTICPICADRSQSRRRARFNDPIRSQIKMVESGKRHAYMITYTITDGSNLSERLEHLKESKKIFRKMGQKRIGGRSEGEAGKIKAAISTIEIKRGDKSHLWHVHCHDLVFTDTPIDYEIYDRNRRRKLRLKYGDAIPKQRLSEVARNRVEFRGELVPVSKVSREWLTATGGDSLSISVDPIKHVPKNCKGKKKRMFRKMSFEDSIAYQAREVLKYITKPSDNTPDDSIEIITHTFNKRMVATYGDFRAIPGDDYNDGARGDEQTFVLMWNDEKGKYGDPIPCRLRDIIEDDQSKETRSKAGRILGEYRRQRRLILESREKYGKALYSYLDALKEQFKRQISSIWSIYRQTISSKNRMTYAGCDKYSPVVAAAGFYFPGSDSKDIYAAAFS